MSDPEFLQLVTTEEGRVLLPHADPPLQHKSVEEFGEWGPAWWVDHMCLRLLVES